MAERSLRMRQARGSMPLSSTRATLVAHVHEPPVPGLVSSVGRAHDSYDLRRSHERRRLLRSCGRGFNPRIGCKEFSAWWGSTLSRVPRKNARQTRVRVPARETNKYTATVPRSLGGQDSLFSLSQTLRGPPVMHTLIFFSRKHPHRASLYTWFDSQLSTYLPLLVLFRLS